MLSVHNSGQVCSFETMHARPGGCGRSFDPPSDLAVVDSRIKKAQSDREDHTEYSVEGVPRDDQPHHGVSRLLDPVQIAVCGSLTHKQHDSGVTVERRNGQKIKCAEEQVQNKHDT